MASTAISISILPGSYISEPKLQKSASKHQQFGLRRNWQPINQTVHEVSGMWFSQLFRSRPQHELCACYPPYPSCFHHPPTKIYTNTAPTSIIHVNLRVQCVTNKAGTDKRHDRFDIERITPSVVDCGSKLFALRIALTGITWACPNICQPECKKRCWVCSLISNPHQLNKCATTTGKYNSAAVPWLKRKSQPINSCACSGSSTCQLCSRNTTHTTCAM